MRLGEYKLHIHVMKKQKRKFSYRILRHSDRTATIGNPQDLPAARQSCKRTRAAGAI